MWRTFSVRILLFFNITVCKTQFFSEQNDPIVDTVLYLQRYKEGWDNGKWEEKYDFRECIDEPRYRLDEVITLSNKCFL